MKTKKIILMMVLLSVGGGLAMAAGGIKAGFVDISKIITDGVDLVIEYIPYICFGGAFILGVAAYWAYRKRNRFLKWGFGLSAFVFVVIGIIELYRG